MKQFRQDLILSVRYDDSMKAEVITVYFSRAVLSQMSTMLMNLLFTTKHHESVWNQERTEMMLCDNLYLKYS